MVRLTMKVDPTAPAVLLRVEGLAVFGAALLLYRELGASWWLFLALALAPDVSLLAFLAGARAGAACYNLVHTYALPAVAFAGGFITETKTAMAVGLVWAAHIGVDRALGLGLKYPTRFRDTHLHRVKHMRSEE